MKTGDPQRPWVRIPPSPPFTTESPFTNFALEKYSRGRRGAPAKGVGRETGARVQIPPSPPEKAPHFRAGLFTLLSGFGPERRKARAKNPTAACGGCREDFLAQRSARPRRLRPPTAAPGTARGAALSVPAALPCKHLKQSPLFSPPPRHVQQESFGAAVGKAEAVPSADGCAGHRKRGRAFRPGRTALQALETEPAFLPAAAACAARIFWRSGRQGRGGCARRWPRRAPQEGPHFPSRPRCPANA